MRPTRPCSARAALLGGVVLLVTGCPAPDALPPPLNIAAGVQAEYLAEGAVVEAVAASSDGRVFYTEKNTGQIRVIREGVLLDEPFATVPVNFAGSRGLLGITLHPQYLSNGRVYVFYARSDTGIATDDPRAIIDYRVVYFIANGDRADSGEVFVTAVAAGEATSRIGGRIAFHPEGALLVGIGDQDDPEAPQDKARPFGKILRFLDNGEIPVDNPDPESAVYARGFRDPGDFAIDPRTGNVFVIEHYSAYATELDPVLAGRNYGWPGIIGAVDTQNEEDLAAVTQDYVEPIFTTDSRLTGLGFNPSTKYGPEVGGLLFYVSLDRGEIRGLELSDSQSAVLTSEFFGDAIPTPTDIQFTPAGTLYIASQNAVYRAGLFWPD